MRVILFSSQTYDRDSFLGEPLPPGLELQFQPARLNLDTVALAEHHEVVCAFINDDLSAPVLEHLAKGGTRLIALRSAGYNHVDLAVAKRLGLTIVRVPLIRPCGRRTRRSADPRTQPPPAPCLPTAPARVTSACTVLPVSTWWARLSVLSARADRRDVARIMAGFGCKFCSPDPLPRSTGAGMGARYVSLPQLLAQAQIISLALPADPRAST